MGTFEAEIASFHWHYIVVIVAAVLDCRYNCFTLNQTHTRTQSQTDTTAAKRAIHTDIIKVCNLALIHYQFIPKTNSLLIHWKHMKTNEQQIFKLIQKQNQTEWCF